MSKAPKNLPEVGERVKLRGRTATGKMVALSERGWADVEWDAEHTAPVICHLHELERLQ
jgi:hypothetical protein